MNQYKNLSGYKRKSRRYREWLRLLHGDDYSKSSYRGMFNHAFCAIHRTDKRGRKMIPRFIRMKMIIHTSDVIY